jgi:hypothetical protein
MDLKMMMIIIMIITILLNPTIKLRSKLIEREERDGMGPFVLLGSCLLHNY